MTEICLVRHGQTDWNAAGRIQGREDIPLNAAGRLQAVRCGEYLRQTQWDALAASPLKRALDTARIIGAAVGIEEITAEPGLIERDFGHASGLTNSQIRKRYPDFIPGQESWEALKKRSMRALTHIASAFPKKRVIAVSHGALINCILFVLSDGKIGTGITWLTNACFSFLKLENGKWAILSYNQSADGSRKAAL